MTITRERLLQTPAEGLLATAALVARAAAGLTFLGFSAGKFTRHEAEAGAFDRYGVPLPDVATYLIGLLELGGGLLLVLGLLVRPVALVLAGEMVGAVLTGGRVDGGLVHLGLAPLLAVTMVALVRVGAGRTSLDLVLLRRLRAAPDAVPA